MGPTLACRMELDVRNRQLPKEADRWDLAARRGTGVVESGGRDWRRAERGRGLDAGVGPAAGESLDVAAGGRCSKSAGAADAVEVERYPADDGEAAKTIHVELATVFRPSTPNVQPQ